MDPATTPATWPPTTLRGVAATLSGTTKMVKTVEAIATTMAMDHILDDHDGQE